MVVHFGDYFVGKTYHIPNTFYPRWEDQSFNIDIPHSHDIHKLPPLRIEVFDMNNMRDDVFLGGVILDTSYTKTLLGFDTDASTEETSSTVASTGGPAWFDLLPSPHLTDLQNRLATQGSIEISAVYLPQVAVDLMASKALVDSQFHLVSIFVLSAGNISTVKSGMASNAGRAARSSISTTLALAMGKKPASDSVTDLGAKAVAPTSHAVGRGGPYLARFGGRLHFSCSQ